LNIGIKKQKTKTQAHKQGAVNKYDLTVFIRLFQSSESCAFFQGHNSLLLDSLDLTAVPQPRFPVQGHILSIAGDVLTASSPDMNAQSFQWIPGCHFVCPAGPKHRLHIHYKSNHCQYSTIEIFCDLIPQFSRFFTSLQYLFTQDICKPLIYLRVLTCKTIA
jgi:hypothetical protein